ncbi:hypothetical protein EMPS_09223 [Entomortierella parvispora]|uniref:Uncharacterized protein n=1 Tax=Entomortierella parvispora TaxID=205924 RepID=A0A9P3HHK3_9FUNG|nr:hypothetical protein EMPS_09223 [Entomortierella parvispora]
MRETPLTGRQKLKDVVVQIEHCLADLNILFDKTLLSCIGQDGTQYIDFSSIRERCFLPEDLSDNQLRRAIKYDAKGRLELHPDLDMVRRSQAYDESEAVDRMLFVDDVDITGHEAKPDIVFKQLLLPCSNAVAQAHAVDSEKSEELPKDGSDTETLIQQTVIRPYGYKETRFFQGFCFVEYSSRSLCTVMANTILSRNNTVRVMPMKQWLKLEREYQRHKQAV